MNFLIGIGGFSAFGQALPSPVAYYPLDVDVQDYSGYNNNGVNNGAILINPGFVGSGAGQFNGSNSFIQIPDSIGTSGNGFTIAFWLKTTDLGGPNWYSGEGLVDGTVAGVTNDFGTALVNGCFALGIGQPNTTLASAAAINDGNWHHAAATWNMTNGAMNVYVDGVLSASGTGPTGPRVASTNLCIGSIQTGVSGGFLNGTIDDVKLYNSELNAQQMIALKNSYAGVAAGTVGYWQFNNPTNLGMDSSGFSNTLQTASGNPTFSSAGLFGGCLHVDGNSTLSLPGGVCPYGLPVGGSPYTIAVWEKVDTGCLNDGGFFGWGANAVGEGNNLRVNGPDSLDNYWYADDFVVSGLTANPMDGNWHSVVATWDGTNQLMYVDGLNVGSRTPAAPDVQDTDFIVGKTTADVNFRGWLENLLVVDRAVTTNEVALYQTGNWSSPLGAYPETPTASPSNFVYAGTTVTLNVVVGGTPPYQYQWQKNGTNIGWGTSAALMLTNTQTTDSGNYGVVVANVQSTNISPAIAVTVIPDTAPIFSQQPSPVAVTNYFGGLITFAAVVKGTPPIEFQWQLNGTNLPNANASSLTLAGLQPGAAGNYTLVASNILGVSNSLPAVLTVLPPPNPAALNVLTYHNDNTRQGANTNEVLLTLANVNSATFGRLITYPTDGYIYAQPLYVYGLVIPGQGTHNAVIVATENDSVYAFDADSNAGTNGGLIWHVNLGTAVSSYNDEFGNRYQGSYYGDIVPVVGITGTPVIDLASGTLYVNVHTREVGVTTNYFQRIHALSIINGNEKAYSPVVVSNSVPGTGVDSVNGVITFNPQQENQRPALTLAGGMLYVGYGSFADTDPFHGWVIGFNATNLQTSAGNAFCSTPNASAAVFGVNAGEGALWMGGNGLCVDACNNLYFVTGNGSFSANTNGVDYGDSFIKLTTTNGLAVGDYFSPYNQATMALNDIDLGSGGDLLLPDSAGSVAHPHLIVGAGKEGTIRLLDRDSLGHFNAANDNQIVQELPGALGGTYSTPAYFNQQIYFQASSDVMKAFLITNGVIAGAPTSQANTSFNALGGTPSISANGTNNGIVWTLQLDAVSTGGPAVLHAYNATNLAQELYNSSQNLPRDNPGPAINMTTPTVVNGKVFVGTQYALSIFGNAIFMAAPVIAPAGGVFTNELTVTLSDATPGAQIYYTLDGTLPTTNSLLYTGPLFLTNSVGVQAIAAESGGVNSGAAAASYINISAIGVGAGLLGQYWTNTSFTAFTNLTFNTLPTLTRTDAVIYFNWNTVGPDPTVGQTYFTARWTGCVQPQFNEPYTFYATADDGVRLWVNGQLLIDEWVNESPTTYQISLPLNAQQLYNIRMDYFQGNLGAEAMLAWSSPSTPQAIIPQSQLYPYTNPPPTVILTAPASGASYTACASVSVSAVADAPYNPIDSVSFFANNNFLGSVSNAPYQLTATGLSTGSYTLTAVAVDGSGLSTTSAPVNITVNPGSGLAYGLTNRATLAPFLNMPTTFNGVLPALLSQTGVFSNTPAMTPVNGLVSYAPNTPLWSDNAQKTRYLAVPFNGGLDTPDQQISFAPTGNWTFPAGTVFVKTFQLNTDTSNPNVLHRLETRLLVRDINGQVYGVTYKWRPDNSDADLLSNSLSEAILITNATGVSTQTWYYPNPADCLTCHTPVANYVLGVNTRQLNGNLTYPSTAMTDNQLRALNRAGYFNPAFDESGIAGFEQLSAVTNQAASLTNRFRSYIDANCAQCHQPGGAGPIFDARYDTPLASQNIIYAGPGPDNTAMVVPQDIWRSEIYQRADSVVNGVKMPPLAKNLVDTNAMAMMAAWINCLSGTSALAPVTITPNGGSFFSTVDLSLQAPDTNAAIYFTLDGTLPTTNSTHYSGTLTLSNSVVVSASAFRAGYNNSVSVSAVFQVQPLQFTSQLFTNSVFQLTFAGAPGSNYVLQASTNLSTWIPISTNSSLTNIFKLMDPQATNFPYRFYRVQQQ